MKISTILKQGTAPEKYLPKVPPNTKVWDYEKISSWDGKLALVFGPSYSKHTPSDREFNPAKRARYYEVRPMFDIDGKPLAASDNFVGKPFSVGNRQINYEKTTWEGGYPYPQKGRFGLPTGYWVTLSLKELWPGEALATAMYLDRKLEYFDATGDKITGRDWKAAFTFKSFQDLQDKMPSDKANYFEYVIKSLSNGRIPEDERQENALWLSLPGVFAMDKKRESLKYILNRK